MNDLDAVEGSSPDSPAELVPLLKVTWERPLFLLFPFPLQSSVLILSKSTFKTASQSIPVRR